MLYEGSCKRCVFKCSKGFFNAVFVIIIIGSVARFSVKSFLVAYPQYENAPYDMASDIFKKRPDLHNKYSWVLEYL